MSSRDEDFLAKWQAEKPACASWGDFVALRVQALIAAKVPAQQLINFVRIPPKARVKDDESLLQKAFYRSKPYTDPFTEIEDKVGVRFVLLQFSDVRFVRDLVLAESDVWDAVKARDHEDEIAASPYEFGYQSVHLIVRAKASSEHDVPEGTKCELQVRTLLQHAYSEVTHDTLYKPRIRATSTMKRAAAKSMALIEATGDYFDQLASIIAGQVAPLVALNEGMISLYSKVVGSQPTAVSSPLNELLLDRYGPGVEAQSVEAWAAERPFVGVKIASRRDQRAAFRLPSILLVYFAVHETEQAAKAQSHLDEKDLELIYSDLGKSLSG